MLEDYSSYQTWQEANRYTCRGSNRATSRENVIRFAKSSLLDLGLLFIGLGAATAFAFADAADGAHPNGADYMQISYDDTLPRPDEVRSKLQAHAYTRLIRLLRRFACWTDPVSARHLRT